MRPQDLQTAIGRLLEHSPAFPGDSLAVDLIANPKAGGFTRSRYSLRRQAELDSLLKKAELLPRRSGDIQLRLHLTERSGHAAEISHAIMQEADSDKPGIRHIILTAGGDGTSLETASSLISLSGDMRSRFSLIRLPYGTGNDGSEGRDLIAALGRFLGPVRQDLRRAIRVTPNPMGGKKPLYSFNIASVGVDAYICKMTNKLKTVFPGDSYKFWVDFSSVFYDCVWPPAPIKVSAFDEKGTALQSFERACQLVAMGASGHRDYGSGIHILPDDDNVCAVYQMPLLKKLQFKEWIAQGTHRGHDVINLFSARKLVFEYQRGILLERDGEVDELGISDFPLSMELTEPLYNVLMPANK